MPEVLTAEELAGYLGVHYRTVLQLAREGQLPGRRVGNSWRFHKQAIDAWLAGQMRGEQRGGVEAKAAS